MPVVEGSGTHWRQGPGGALARRPRKTSANRATDAASLEAVTRYYEHSWSDYKKYWISEDDLALHFGYYERGIWRHRDALLNMNQALTRRVDLRPGERVLDAGCGVGGSAMWLAQHCDAEVVGISVVESQVTCARAFAARRGLGERVRFEHADFTDAPFPDGSFDVVWAIESVCYASEPLAFYREAFRLLRPGGRLVVADGMRTARPLRPGVESLLRQWADGWAVPDLHTGSEHVDHAAAAGFADVQLDHVSSHVSPSVALLLLRTVLALPANLARRRFGVRSAVQHGNSMSALRLGALLLAGGAFYGILCAERGPSERGTRSRRFRRSAEDRASEHEDRDAVVAPRG